MARIGVAGGGIIGRGWSIVFARAGHDVALYDSDAAALQRALGGIAQALQVLEQNEPGFVAAPVLARIQPCADLESMARDTVHIQENVPENPALKTALFEVLDRLAPPSAVLASSTSSFPASSFLSGIPGRHRCLVAHPSNPPHLLPIVEVVPAPWTAAATTEACERLLRDCGRTVIRVAYEIAGFVFNRLQAALLAEALRLVDKGVASAEDVDVCIRDGLGFRWAVTGPIESMDLASRGGFAESASKYGPGVKRFWPDAELWRPETSEAIDRWCRERHGLDEHGARELKRDAKMIRIQQIKDQG